MLNQFHLQSLGFTLEDNTFTNNPLYVFGKQDVEYCGVIYNNVPIIYYDIEKQLAKASRGEFSNISRICDTIEDLNKFIECIMFLFNLKDLKKMDKSKWIEVLKPNYTNGNYIWVVCIAEIKNNTTGEVVEYETEEILDYKDDFPSVFNWEENNYSCDCNRLLFFKRAKNEETEEDFDKECSHGKFSVNLKNKKDGKIYYKEF